MNTDIYWAVVRNQNKRHGYIEVTNTSDDKWEVVLGDNTVRIKTTSRDFYEILGLAITKQYAL